MATYRAKCVWEANRQPKEGNYGDYHQASFNVYDADGNFIIDDDTGEPQRVSVFVQADNEQEAQELIAIKKGAITQLEAYKNKGGNWKWKLVSDSAPAATGPFGGAPQQAPAQAPAQQAPVQAPQQTPTAASDVFPPPALSSAAQAPQAQATKKVADIDRHYTEIHLPDEAHMENVLNALSMHGTFMHRMWQIIAREFEAEPTSIPPSEESIQKMVVSEYIEANRRGWL